MDDLRLQETVELGEDTGRGNLLGIQPWMRPDDYASEAAFFERLAGYFQAARQKGWVTEKTVLVLPEYLSTWLVAAGESPAVYRSPTIAVAMRYLVGSHLLAFARTALTSREKDRIVASLFRLKAPDMARIYQSVFSRLSREYAVTLVAGSILLPAPYVENGRVLAGKGPLYNVSAVFRPDGRAEPRLAGKVFPIAEELPFVTPALVEDLPVFDTPAGRLGVLVCADSWFPTAYQKIKEQAVDIVAVPSAQLQGNIWFQPWKGYSGFPAPADVDQADIGQINEGQAWHKYSLAGRMASAGARAGINVFFYGDLWDLSPCGGRGKMVQGSMVKEASCDGALLLNLWL